MTNDGSRTFSVTTEVGLLTFVARWMPIEAAWYLDIYDGAGATIATGIALLAGCPNLIAGLGNTQLDGYALEVYAVSPGSERSPECWGVFAWLVLRSPGDAAYTTVPDLLEDATW
jgi:hypothetical protein